MPGLKEEWCSGCTPNTDSEFGFLFRKVSVCAHSLMEVAGVFRVCTWPRRGVTAGAEQ